MKFNDPAELISYLSALSEYEFAIEWPGLSDDDRNSIPKADVGQFLERAREGSPWLKGNGHGGSSPRHDPRAVAWNAEQSVPASRTTNMLNWDELNGDPPPFEWLMEPWLSWHPTLMAGKGGIGKSLLIQELATQWAAGLPTWCPPTRPLRVLYWACEDDKDQLWRRENAICKHLKIPFSELTNLHVDARCGLDNTIMSTEFGQALWTPNIEILRQQLNDLQIDILCLDNIAHCYGANENVRHDVTKFVNGITGLVKERPFCPIFLGHPAKGIGSEFSGSSAWENSVRMRWYLNDRMPDQPTTDTDEAPDPNYRVLAKRKNNYTVSDYVQFQYDAGFLVPQQSAMTDSGLARAIRQRQTKAIIIAAIKKLSAVQTFCNDFIGRNYLPSVILQNKLAEGHTKAELKEAMLAMILSEELVRDVVGKNAARRPIIGLRVSASS